MRNAVSKAKPESYSVSKGSNSDINYNTDNLNIKRNKRELREEVSSFLVKR